MKPRFFMSNFNPDTRSALENAGKEDTSFAEILSNFEQQHSDSGGTETIQGIVVSVSPEAILVDIGRKTEGSLPRNAWSEHHPEEPKVGDTVPVVAGGRDSEGYYQLSLLRVERPKDWTGLQRAFDEKHTIAGTVVEQVKGGFRVDVGVRAFMPASRSGVREADEMANLVGQEIQCRITKLDTDKEDVVVDRRVVLEEEQARRKDEVFSALKEGAVVQGRVRNVMDFGAFVDIGGMDGLLHVVDMSWNRISKPSDVVKPGDQLTVKILKIDPSSKKISLGLKQLQEDPWTIAARTFQQGQRVNGTVSRLTDFGAFVELLPGVDGLIHLSEMSWDRRIRKPGDLLKVGDRVEAVVLQVNAAEKRVSLGLKQALGDPWETLPQKYPVGSQVEGKVTNLAPFGAFVDLGEGIEGMIHISDITNEKRLDHPKDMLAKGQQIRAVVIELDKERRRIRLGMKHLEPTKADHYIAEHRVGDTVSGRVVEVQGTRAKVELGEGVVAACSLKPKEDNAAASQSERSSDVSALGAMLASRWKQGGSSGNSAELAREGQVRSFRITQLDEGKRMIELELAS
jgi:small subunit ribosomal protein S1